MHRRQGWKETTPEGDRREVRATRLGQTWRIQSRRRSENEWTEHDPPSLDDVQTLLDLLRRKYTRRRASLTEVENVEKWIARMRETPG